MKILLAIIIFSILILIHEFGHFLLARKNGVRVVEFSLGFGPRILSFNKGDTRYSWKLLPFGGSCIMQGENEEEEEGDDQNKSFDSKSVWARMAIIFAGPLFNFLLALVLAIIVTGFAGYDPPRVSFVEEGSPAYEAGLREGDVITKYNRNTIFFSREIGLEEYINPLSEEPVSLTYIRDGEKQKISVIPEKIKWYAVGMRYTISEDTPAKIDSVVEDSPLDQAGIISGDIVLAIQGNEINNNQEMNLFFTKSPLTKEPISFTISREGETFVVSVSPEESSAMSLGIEYNYIREKTSPLGVLKYGFLELQYEVEMVYKSLGMLFTGKVGADDLAGPVGIVDVIGDTYEATVNDGWFTTFISMSMLVIILSANLGVVNLLPIPALDGGKIIFLIIEAVRGKPVPKNKEGIVHFIGMVLLILLMAFVLFNDIRRL